MQKKFMARAIELAGESMSSGGGPFGAVVVYNNQIVAEGSNSVTLANDPTAHAEVVAIREAGKRLEKFNLEDCTLYSSCEPCPMCLGAIYWSRIQKVYFAASRKDAESAGFDDSHIYQEISKNIGDRSIKMIRVEDEDALEIFRKWDNLSGKTRY